jgi:hypothetical protein
MPSSREGRDELVVEMCGQHCAPGCAWVLCSYHLAKGFRAIQYGVVSTIPSSNMCQLGLWSVDTVISNKGVVFSVGPINCNGFAIRHRDIFLSSCDRHAIHFFFRDGHSN